MSIFTPDWQGIDVELGILRDEPKPATDIRGTSDAGLFFCSLPGTSGFDMCRVPTIQEIAADPSTYGPALSQESRDRAAAMTLQQLADDCRTNPGSYVDIPGSCSYRAPNDYLPLILIGGLALLFMVRH